MLRGVERAPLESRKAIRRATATDEVCILPAALVGAVATFVLAVTQPASDDANATSANPVEIRRVAVTRSFDIRTPLDAFRPTSESPITRPNEVDHGNTRANMAGAVRVVAIFLSVANEKQFAWGFRSRPSPGRMMVLLRRRRATPTPQQRSRGGRTWRGRCRDCDRASVPR